MVTLRDGMGALGRLNRADPGAAASFDQLLMTMRRQFTDHGVDLTDPVQRHAALTTLEAVSVSVLGKDTPADLHPTALLCAMALAVEEA